MINIFADSEQPRTNKQTFNPRDRNDLERAPSPQAKRP